MAKKKTRRAKRGLYGTPHEHVRAFYTHIGVAKHPVANGCQSAIESLGAAKAHFAFMPNATPADDARRERLGLKSPSAAIRAARDAIAKTCLCKKG